MDAPLGSAEFEASNELERLQRRAYGPDADIAGDAAAQARLSELETAHRHQSTPGVHAAGGVPASMPEGTPTQERVPSTAPVEGSRPASASVAHIDGGAPAVDRSAGAPSAPWHRRWSAIVVVALAALAVDAALVGWMSQLLAWGAAPIPTDTPTQTQPLLDAMDGGYDVVPPDYVLALESAGADADVPKDPHGTLDRLGLSAGNLRRYENFGYLSVWSGVTHHGTVCVLVSHPVQGLNEGIGAEACAPEGLDTIADLLMPSGRLNRFVLKRDRVDVYTYVKSVEPVAPPG